MSALSRLLKKGWTPEETEALLGTRISTLLMHAEDTSLRAGAASGGAVTALLVHALESGLVDGALVCKTVVTQGRARPHFKIATSTDDLLGARGSVYVATRFAHDALPLIREFDGTLAVVGLPCDLTVLRKACEADADLDNKVRLAIGLLCGHNSCEELTDLVTARLEKQAGSRLVAFRHRMGHWRGSSVATFEDGSVIEQSFKKFSVYQNLYYYADTKCMFCGDHFAYDADISAGDVWSAELRAEEIKHTGAIVRSQAGAQLVDSAIEAKALVAKDCSPELILDGQARTAPFHYNVSARARAGRLLGMRIPDKLRARVKVHEYLAALIALTNYRMTRSSTGRAIVRRIPKPLLTAYLYLFKGLESLK